MQPRTWYTAWIWLALPLLAQALDYDRDIRPILSENCFHCHGQDATKRMADLSLDSYEGATANRAGRVALVPGKPEASVLYQRITAENKAVRMPPASSNRTLSPSQVATLKRWIAEGGEYTKHWAFIPPARPAVPPGTTHPIDAFVRKRLESERLAPRPPAAPEVWFRRVALDLVGLPPSPAELDAFSNDAKAQGEAAYRKVVDRLLESPRYGERMAMDWLDVARYADTHGFNNDAARSMWRWRDWVIEAFNANMPYDRFLTEQLAGDLLPNPTLDQRIATGYGRNHVINSEGGIIDEEYRVEYVADRVRTLGMSWLGLTLECARCHDHKYDPITQRDHYRFYAFFNNVPEIGEDGRVANAVPMIPAPTREQQAKMRHLEAAIARLPAEAASRPVVLPPGEPIVADKGVPVSKRTPMTFAFQLEPTDGDNDVAILSAMDFARNRAATTYGNGIELRLVGGEVEFRFGQRFPAYSMRVRSEGASIAPGRSRQIVVVYEGATKSAMRAYASWVRMFIDGRELATRILNDGVSLPEEKSDKPSSTKFRIGHDNSPNGKRYGGKLEEPTFWPRALTDEEIGAPRTLRTQLLAFRRGLPTMMVMQDMDKPRQTHILVRGAYNSPGDKVDAGVPEDLLGAWPEGAPRNRLGLARWLTKPDHPLTARVVVNRFWQQVFGQGLVKTSDNFGVQGESPSHPELLDWLAREFVDSGWDVKSLMRMIVLSGTYRQDSAAPPELLARDPENRLLARGPRFRLPAEAIRDHALAVSGLIHHEIGGPSVHPYQPADLYKGMVVAADYPGTKWVEDTGDNLYRRSLYTFWKRTVPHPTMTVFDAPDREVCVVRRSTTNTPLQALTLLNDPIFVEAARKLAERAIHEGGDKPDSRLAFAFRLATGRSPDDHDRRILRSTYDKLFAAYRTDEPAAQSLLKVGASASASDASIPAAELAAYTAVANIILNLDETITKG